MAKKLVRAFSNRVFGNIEDCLVVRGPGETIDSLDLLRKKRARLQVLDLQSVLAVAGVVSRVGEQIAVVAGSERAYAHELLSLGKLVLVQHDFFFGIEATLLAAEDWILFTLLRARVVEVITQTIGHVLVRLLDVAEHLLVELRLQAFG